MNCRYVRRHMADLFDEEGAQAAGAELRRHLETCSACASEFDVTRRVLAVPIPEVRASADFKERTMRKLATLEAADVPRRRVPAWAPRFAWVSAAAVCLVVGLPYLGGILGRHGSTPSGVMALLAQSVQAMSNLESVHMRARMRTLPNDNFEMIGLRYDFVPVELWKQFGEPPRWRVEKPGRVVVMDGVSSLLFIKPDHAVRGGPGAGFVEWLKPLLDADHVLAKELRAAQQGRSQATLTEEMRGGARTQVLTVSRRAMGDFANDWARNRSIFEADHVCVYRFDAAASRLTGLQVWVREKGRDVLVFEITDIRYNEPLDPALFTIAVPGNVNWDVPPEEMPVAARPLPSTAREAALTFLDGMSRQDWEQVSTVYSPLNERFKKYAAGVQVLAIGEPFRSGLYPGWFVPYEIRFPDGGVKKHNLAVRNDNPAGRFVIDGGF